MASGFLNKQQTQSLAEHLTKKTKFTKDEINKLLEEYPSKGLQRGEFRDKMVQLFGITDDIILDRLFRTCDKDQDGVLNQQELIEGFSTLVLGDEDEQINLCFNVYDMTGTGHITRDDVFHLLKGCLVVTSSDEDGDEETKNLVEIALKLLDEGKRDRRDQIITRADYADCVKSGAVFTDILGTIIPNKKRCEMFLESLQDPNSGGPPGRHSRNQQQEQQSPTHQSRSQSGQVRIK